MILKRYFYSVKNTQMKALRNFITSGLLLSLLGLHEPSIKQKRPFSIGQRHFSLVKIEKILQKNPD